MEAITTRFMLTVPIDMANRAETLKKDIFYDKPYAEMYRQFIKLGMQELEKEAKENRRDRVS